MPKVLQKTVGYLLVQTGDVYRDITLPMTLDASLDLSSIECDERGKLLKTRSGLHAHYPTKRLGDFEWDRLVGDGLVRKAVDEYLQALGHLGAFYWAPMEHQAPGKLTMRPKPALVASIFPEALMMVKGENELRR